MVMTVCFLPRNGRVRLRVLLAVALVVAGEAILLGHAGGGALVNGVMSLEAGLMFLAEIATSNKNLLVPLMWGVLGLTGLALLLSQRHELIAWVDVRRSWLALGGAAGALILGVLAVHGHRRSITVRYDPHDLSGF
ncbi:hypothetical protein [Actinoallomurus sp. CA-142502]|uniref:hypothetical protein n=1 Tax=Actinoallomurus sp. CA-142502 TaxID=3239885 RepID=UPI003D8EC236